jgi:DNA-binding response OmpR family regulator
MRRDKLPMSEKEEKKILIVDDDPGDILWLKRIINSHYIIIEALDGLCAVEIAAKEKPDLVILDVMMPKVSGYTVCANLKENHETRNIPVVMVTGLGTEMNKKIGEEMGADGYLTKPVTPDKLLSTISIFLE